MPNTKKTIISLARKASEWGGRHFSHIPFVQKIFFMEHLYTMLHAGLSLVEALNVLSQEIESKKFKGVIGEIKNDVEKGQQLSEATAKYPKVFESIHSKMIAAGETAGKLEDSLEQIIAQMHKSHELTSSIRSAMIYPAVIIVAMVGIGIMMVTMVLPKLVTLFEEFNAELPLATRLLIAISHFLGKPLNLIILLCLIFLSVAGFIACLKKIPSFRFAMHKFNLRLPLFGQVIKKINLARFSLTLSSLLKSTIPITYATEIAADTCTNLAYNKSLHEAAQKIKSGTPMSEILANYPKLFPPMVTEMVMVGEKTGEVSQLLTELANFYSKEVDKTMKNFAIIIEPVIILLLGIAVAGMAVAIIMPMYTLVQNF